MGSSTRRRRHQHSLSCPSLEVLEDRIVMAADAVIDWNNIALDAIRVDKTAPPRASRALAILHVAIYDSVNAIERTHEFYLASAVAHPDASPVAAVAAAAHSVLTSLFPAQAATFDAAYDECLDAVPDGISEDFGVALGESVADEILDARSSDGSTTVVPYTPGTDPGDWQPTPSAFAAALLPQWPNVTPFAMTSGSQFRPDGIPDLDSAEYAAAFNEVKELGDKNSATRTDNQTDIALFWANGSGTATPPGHLNLLAQTVSDAEGLTLAEDARLFALLNIALADAAIASWDAKYATSFWRPVTAIRAAGTDGNEATEADALWTPLITTPPFPAYTSGHSSFSGAAAAVLAEFFGTDDIAFTLPSENPAIEDRSFNSFSEAAEESAVSRIYGGIHFNFDNNDGLSSGTKLGNYVAQNLLQAADLSTAAGIVDGVLIVTGTDGRDRISITSVGNNLIVRDHGHKIGVFSISAVDSIAIDAGRSDDRVSIAANIQLASMIYGGTGNDTLLGGGGRDLLMGEAGRDLLCGNAGNDDLDGGEGNDLLLGGRGIDELFGGSGDDLLFGGLGRDVLKGGSGRNRLFQ